MNKAKGVTLKRDLQTQAAKARIFKIENSNFQFCFNKI